MIKVLSEGFDPAWRLLLFCESVNLRLYAPADGSGAIAESGKKFIGIRQGSPEEAIAGHVLEEYTDAASTEPA